MIGFGSSNIISGMIDLHCHIVPYVDDGAEDIEEAKNIIRDEYNQGVRLLVMTVHLRYGTFDTPIEKVQKHFQELKKWLSQSDMRDMTILLSREYYCDDRLEALLDGYIQHSEEVVYKGHVYSPKEEILPFGEYKCILLEFSSNRIQNSAFERFIEKAMHAGLMPILAHVERYPIVQERPTIVYKLQDLGAYIQVNCESLLDRAGRTECETAQILVQKGLVDFVSSDTHDLKRRPPNHKKCYSALQKKYGKDIADKLLRNNAEVMIYGME